MAKLLPCTFVCLLLVIAATACHPKPPRTTPFPGGPTTTSPKFTGVTSAHSSTRSTQKPTTTKPLPKDVQEIVDALNEADESSKKASETLKKILEGGEVATEIAEMFLEDLPIIGGVMKVFGSLFSIFANAIESKMIMKELEKIFDEMQRQFAEVNRRLDMLAWQLTDMMNEISTKLAHMELNEQFNKILVIQGAKKMYEDHQDSTTLQGLRDACSKLTNPSEVIDVVANMITKATSNVNIASIAATMEYDGKKWSTYTSQIGQHFVQAMLLEQACLGVKINDDKTRPTAEDRQLYANVSSAKFVEVMKGMAAVGKYIDQWFQTRVPNDVETIATSTYQQSTQAAADAIRSSLTSKYGGVFAVVVYKTSNDHLISNTIFDGHKAAVFTHRDRTIVVTWALKPNQHSNQISLADKAVSTIPCRSDPNSGGLWDVRAYFTNAIASSAYDSHNFNSIYFVAATSNVDIGTSYDHNDGPMYVNGKGKCRWQYTKCVPLGHGHSCAPVISVAFEYHAIFGF